MKNQMLRDGTFVHGEAGPNIAMVDGDSEVNLFYRSLEAETTADKNPVGGSSMPPTGGPSGTRILPDVEAQYTKSFCNARQYIDASVNAILSMANKNERFVDDITGQPLPPELCRVAHRSEIGYFKSKGVWELRKIAEAIQRTGKRPISIRWVEVNKADSMNPKIRSRLVAREIRGPGQEACFAPTPPLESFRMVLSYAIFDIAGQKPKTWNPKSDDRMQLLLLDISRAYFNAKTDDAHPTYVDLPAEAGVSGLLRSSSSTYVWHAAGGRRPAKRIFQRAHQYGIHPGFCIGMCVCS